MQKLKKIDKYTLNRISIKKKANRQDLEFIQFRMKYLGIEDGDNEQRYDCCVIGSDEVFNCLSDSSWGFTSQLFGNVWQASKVITYAASCGATRIEDVPQEMKTVIKNAFERVSAFSVRDENTRTFVNALTDKKIQINLDPVVVGNFDSEISACGKLDLPQHYCIVYSYYNRIHTKEEIEKVKKFCTDTGLTPVAVGAPQMWIKEYPVLTPFETLLAFKSADYVITDTFHGTIFAAKYSKVFATMVRSSNSNKLTDLLSRLDLTQHKISDFSELDGFNPRFNNDPTRLAQITENELSRTMAYLQENLKKA